MNNELYESLLNRYRSSDEGDIKIIAEAKQLADAGETGAIRFLYRFLTIDDPDLIKYAKVWVDNDEEYVELSDLADQLENLDPELAFSCAVKDVLRGSIYSLELLAEYYTRGLGCGGDINEFTTYVINFKPAENSDASTYLEYWINPVEQTVSLPGLFRAMKDIDIDDEILLSLIIRLAENGCRIKNISIEELATYINSEFEFPQELIIPVIKDTINHQIKNS